MPTPTMTCSATDMQCDRGYRHGDGDICTPILLPANAFLVDAGYIGPNDDVVIEAGHATAATARTGTGAPR